MGLYTVCLHDQCLCSLCITGKGLWIKLDKMIALGNTIFIEVGLTAAFNLFLALESNTDLSFFSIPSSF